jgi:hypothetical protein
MEYNFKNYLAFPSFMCEWVSGTRRANEIR